MEIRICTPEMADDLQYICRKTFYETFSEQNSEEDMREYLDETYDRDRLSEELADPESVTYIAYENGEPAGYLKLNTGDAQTEEGYDGTLEVQRIYVSKEVKGSGIGSRFMSIAEDHAREHGLGSIWLGVWEHNDPAIAFYRSKGFEKFSEHVFVVGNDRQTDILMKKQLD